MRRVFRTLHEHPAKYSKSVLAEIVNVLETYPLLPGPVLDPMSGVGRIHNLRELRVETYGVEIEPEWASATTHNVVADATALPFRRGAFAAIICSPPYGNRMADHHAAKERCRQCNGSGVWVNLKGPGDDESCPKCKGAGKRSYKRNTYRHILGRVLTRGNVGGMPFVPGKGGDEYRRTMLAVLRSVKQALQPGGLVLWNVSNYIRKGEEIDVVGWYETVFHDLRFAMVEKRPVTTRRNRFGANRNLRATCEWLYVYRLPNESSQ